MTPNAAIALIANRLGKRGSALDTEIVAELQAAQVELEEKPELPWFLLHNNTALATVAATKTMATPSGFILEDEFGGMFAVGTDGGRTRVVKKDYDTLRASQHFSTSKIPAFYARQSTTVYFFPTPDLAYTIEWWYFRNDPDTITAGGAANLWLTYAPSVLYNLAGLQIARYLRFPDAAQIFERDYITAYSRMIARTEASRQAALDAELGG